MGFLGTRRWMFALGQELRFDSLPAASGLPRGTDINRPDRLVRLVPTPEVGDLLFDYLVGLGERRNRRFDHPINQNTSRVERQKRAPASY
jgi:hypothetical protein